ncbi:MAG: malonyl-CoA decarboxylase [bacterium]
MRAPRLLDLFSRIAEVGQSLVASDDAAESLGDRCEALLSGRGEATGLALAQDILERYAKLPPADKHAFFAEAARRFGVDEDALREALAAWREHDDDDGDGDGDDHGDPRLIHRASEPRSRELIRRLNRAPGATRALVAMRADLLQAAKHDAALKQLDNDFRDLLASWFNRGFLELRRIDWSSSAEVLEKIIAYEAVHAIAGWDDLRQRVAAPDRRLYAFFHPAMPDEPLIFVEVALTDSIPGAIAPILAQQRKMLAPSAATTAVFYSISNCQAGLRGVSFGSFLIKQVVEELQSELKALKHMVTLSPAPGLRRWALEECARGDDGMLSATQRAVLRALEVGDGDGSGDGGNDHDKSDANANKTPSAASPEKVLPEVAARYLCKAKSPRGRPLDRVARFHLGNGARIEQINAAGDDSTRGRESAWGVMVNYRYDLAAIERNHEAFANEGKIVTSTGVKRLRKSG